VIHDEVTHDDPTDRHRSEQQTGVVLGKVAAEPPIEVHAGKEVVQHGQAAEPLAPKPEALSVLHLASLTPALVSVRIDADRHRNVDTFEGEMPSRLERYEKKYRALADELAAIGFISAGSLVSRTTSCGKPGCRCQAHPPNRHGPYYQWSRAIGGNPSPGASANSKPRSTASGPATAATSSGSSPKWQSSPLLPGRSCCAKRLLAPSLRSADLGTWGRKSSPRSAQRQNQHLGRGEWARRETWWLPPGLQPASSQYRLPSSLPGFNQMATNAGSGPRRSRTALLWGDDPQDTTPSCHGTATSWSLGLA